MSNYLDFYPTQATPFYFVSYNSEDIGDVAPLARSLAEDGVPLWYDYGLAYGEEWEQQISHRLRDCEAVLLFFTKRILEKQNSYVRKEYDMAIRFFHKKVYVVLLDSIQDEDVPVSAIPWWMEITRRQCIDAAKAKSFDERIEMIENAIGFQCPAKGEGSGKYAEASRDGEASAPLMEKSVPVSEKTNQSVSSLYSQGLSFAPMADGTYTVIGIGDCTDTDLIIPPVTPQGGWVTEIGYEAFRECDDLVTVTLPNNVKKICKGAFSHCRKLQSIHIPDSVSVIETYAFAECVSLTDVHIPASVKTVGDWAFFSCLKLKIIYCEHRFKPLGWHRGWNHDSTVVWNSRLR